MSPICLEGALVLHVSIDLLCFFSPKKWIRGKTGEEKKAGKHVFRVDMGGVELDFGSIVRNGTHSRNFLLEWRPCGRR